MPESSLKRKLPPDGAESEEPPAKIAEPEVPKVMFKTRRLVLKYIQLL